MRSISNRRRRSPSMRGCWGDGPRLVVQRNPVNYAILDTPAPATCPNVLEMPRPRVYAASLDGSAGRRGCDSAGEAGEKAFTASAGPPVCGRLHRRLLFERPPAARRRLVFEDMAHTHGKNDHLQTASTCRRSCLRQPEGSLTLFRRQFGYDRNFQSLPVTHRPKSPRSRLGNRSCPPQRHRTPSAGTHRVPPAAQFPRPASRITCGSALDGTDAAEHTARRGGPMSSPSPRRQRPPPPPKAWELAWTQRVSSLAVEQQQRVADRRVGGVVWAREQRSRRRKILEIG